MDAIVEVWCFIYPCNQSLGLSETAMGKSLQ